MAECENEFAFTCEKCLCGVSCDTVERTKVELCSHCMAIAYAELSDTFVTGKFGRVVWDIEDIETALEDAGKPVSDENVEAVLSSYEVRHIEDRMIEAGWQQINSAVEGIK